MLYSQYEFNNIILGSHLERLGMGHNCGYLFCVFLVI